MLTIISAENTPKKQRSVITFTFDIKILLIETQVLLNNKPQQMLSKFLILLPPQKGVCQRADMECLSSWNKLEIKKIVNRDQQSHHYMDFVVSLRYKSVSSQDTQGRHSILLLRFKIRTHPGPFKVISLF